MSDFPTLADRLSVATDKAEAASQIMHEVVNGDADTEVMTESGPVPSIARTMAQLNDQAEGAVGQVAAALDEHKHAENPHPQYETNSIVFSLLFGG